MEKVSVIIPAYNAGPFVRETVESALSQTHPDIEVIVVDDGSTDGTAGILDEYVKSGRIKYYYQKNTGVCSARNAAIRKSSGGYIALLDHDDIWHENKIERQVSFLKAHPEACAVFCDEYQLFPDGSLVDLPPKLQDGEDAFEKLLRYCYTTPSTFMFKREVIDSVGLFNEDLRFHEDWEYFLRIGRRFGMVYQPEYLLTRRVYPESTGARNRDRFYCISKICRSLEGVLDKRQSAFLKLEHNRLCWKHVASMIDCGEFRESTGLFVRIIRHHPRFLAKMPQLLRRGVRTFIRRAVFGESPTVVRKKYYG